DLSIQIAKSEAFPWTVYGITLFPYLICFVWLTGWLYRQDRTKLALFGEWLTFALGMVMTLVSLYNPTCDRSIFFSLLVRLSMSSAIGLLLELPFFILLMG
ncbi:MAG: hypothetical protein HC784_02745, partial [Hydrococcus sp. CSU_1_8]|nr:hypothetical protein [Hydrococcus sp. CSU_1_8]